MKASLNIDLFTGETRSYLKLKDSDWFGNECLDFVIWPVVV
jgi:hypothetical protein